MPLIACPECNGHVSTEARQCPHCGASGDHIRRVTVTSARWGGSIFAALLFATGAYVSARTGYTWIMVAQIVLAAGALAGAWIRSARGRMLAFEARSEEPAS